MNQNIAKYIILIGVAIAVVGILFYFFGDRLKWIGNLPGDIRLESQNTKIYIPLTTMLVFSLVLTIVMRIIQQLK